MSVLLCPGASLQIALHTGKNKNSFVCSLLKMTPPTLTALNFISIHQLMNKRIRYFFCLSQLFSVASVQLHLLLQSNSNVPHKNNTFFTLCFCFFFVFFAVFENNHDVLAELLRASMETELQNQHSNRAISTIKQLFIVLLCVAFPRRDRVVTDFKCTLTHSVHSARQPHAQRTLAQRTAAQRTVAQTPRPCVSLHSTTRLGLSCSVRLSTTAGSMP